MKIMTETLLNYYTLHYMSYYVQKETKSHELVRWNAGNVVNGAQICPQCNKSFRPSRQSQLRVQLPA